MTIGERISEMIALKLLLSDTDHKALQRSEGWLTAEEYEPIRLKREQWRERYRALEAEEEK